MNRDNLEVTTEHRGAKMRIFMIAIVIIAVTASISSAAKPQKPGACSADYEKFCKEMGEQPADVALAWLFKNPVVTGKLRRLWS